MPYDPAWVIITTCTAVYEARTACDLLASAGIVALFRGPHAAYDPGAPGTVAPGVDVLVPAAREAEARDLLGV